MLFLGGHIRNWNNPRHQL